MTVSYTWSWTDIGYPQEIEILEICHTIKHDYGGGYAATRAAAQKMQKMFTLTWPGMESANWLNLVEFWRSVKGSADAFYFEFPLALYGSPPWGSETIGDPGDGFDTDYDLGYGYGPVFTCRFAEDEMPQRFNAFFPGLWAVTVTILEVA